MSSKITTLLAAGVVLLGAAAALTPYGLGARVEDRFRGDVASLSSGGLRGQVIEYRRGWLDSDAVTEWTIRQDAETVTFRLAHRLRHGPTLSGALAEIESTPVLPDDVRQQIKAYLGEQPPVTVATRIGFDGAQRHQLSVPAYQGKVEGAQLNWEGARGLITVDAGVTRVDGSFNAPRLLVEEAATKQKIQVTGTQLSFRYHRASPDASWLGDFEYSTDEISGTDAGDPSATVVVARPQMKASVVDDAGMLAASVEMGASRLDIAGETVDNPTLALAIRRIDAGIYRRIEKQLAEAAEKGYAQEAAEAAMAQLMAEVLPALLARSPEIELTQLGARTNDGAFEVKGRVRYVGKGDIAGFDPKADLEADATARIPVALVSRLAELGAVPGPDAEGLDAETKKAIAEGMKQAISQQIEMLVQTGLAVREGDNVLVSRFELKGGKMTLNGNPADELLSAAALAFGGDESADSGEAINTWTAPDSDTDAAGGSQSAVASQLFEQILAAPDDDLETIERLYLEVIEKAPETDEAQESHWRLATLYLQAYDEPKYAQARAILEQFLARYPESEGVEVVKPALGFIYEELEDWPAAAATYGEFLESADGVPEVIAEFGYSYAKALQNAGRKDDAAVWYRRFLEVVSDPDDQRVHRAKEALGQP